MKSNALGTSKKSRKNNQTVDMDKLFAVCISVKMNY